MRAVIYFVNQYGIELLSQAPRHCRFRANARSAEVPTLGYLSTEFRLLDVLSERNICFFSVNSTGLDDT